MNEQEYREEMIDAMARCMKRVAETLEEKGEVCDWQKMMMDEFVTPLHNE